MHRIVLQMWYLYVFTCEWAEHIKNEQRHRQRFSVFDVYWFEKLQISKRNPFHRLNFHPPHRMCRQQWLSTWTHTSEERFSIRIDYHSTIWFWNTKAKMSSPNFVRSFFALHCSFKCVKYKNSKFFFIRLHSK